MREVERAIENVLSERMAVSEKLVRNPLRMLEDFTLNNLKFLAIGAAGAILTLSSMTFFETDVINTEKVDSIVVGSIDQMTPQARWSVIQKPVQILSLEAPQLAGSRQNYIARKTEQGALQDTLSFEAATKKNADLRVNVTRGLTTRHVPSLYIEMTRQQSERGFAVTKSGQPGTLQSKFGAMEVADMIFSGPDNKSQSCLAFRSQADTAMVGFSGWYCATEANVIERPELSCILDKLVLLKSGQEKELRRVFTEAEKTRTPCATARASTGRKPNWLDADGKAPAFRGDITGSIEEQPLPKKLKTR